MPCRDPAIEAFGSHFTTSLDQTLVGHSEGGLVVCFAENFASVRVIWHDAYRYATLAQEWATR